MDSTTSIQGMSLSLTPSNAYESSSTLQYLNAQLVAHGYLSGSGLSLDGLSSTEGEKVIKCILGILGQRMADITRTEELSSKFRILTYEYDRLQSMHRTALDDVANAERDMNAFKAKFNITQKSLATEVAAHKQTASELQRTRTALQYLRSTTQNELKRKDKDMEKIVERWNRITDCQAKLAGIGSGLRCSNNATEIDGLSRGNGIMEDALEQVEAAREELVKENEGFRSVILGAANALQGIVFDVNSRILNMQINEPTPLSHTAVFAPPTSFLSHPENAHTKLRELTASLRESVAGIQYVKAQAEAVTESQTTSQDEATQLKEQVASLKVQIERLEKTTNTTDKETQKGYDRCSKHMSKLAGTTSEASTIDKSVMLKPDYDDLRGRLEERNEQLQSERQKFTEATVKLGKDKTELEIERAKLVEEKRKWSVAQMLAEMPSTPGPDPDLVVSPKAPKPTSPRSKFSAKAKTKTPTKRTTVRRVSLNAAGDVGSMKLKLRRSDGNKETVEVLYDPYNEVSYNRKFDASKGQTQLESLHRSTTPEDPPPRPSGTSSADQNLIPKTSKQVEKHIVTSQPLALPTAFVLPPPSPASSLMLRPMPLPGSVSELRISSEASSITNAFDKIPLAPRVRIFPSPRTPKPILAISKKHAYSPARPSPLSRILMTADSPPSTQTAMLEEDEGHEKRQIVVPVFQTDMPATHDSNPLRELSPSDLNGKVARQGNEGRLTAKEKGKGRAVASVSEKENNTVTIRKAKVGGHSRTSAISKPTANTFLPSGSVAKPVQKSGVVIKPGGARRIPIGTVGAGTLSGRM